MKAKYSRLLIATFALAGATQYAVGQSQSSDYGPGSKNGSSGTTAGQSQPANSSQGMKNQTGNVGQRGISNPTTISGQGTSGRSGGAWNLDTSRSTRVMYNQAPVNFSDAQPGVMNGQLLIPVRAFAEQAGGTVRWRNDTKVVEIDLPNHSPLQLMSVSQPTAMSNNAARGRAERFSGGGSSGQSGMDDSSSLFGAQEVVIINGRAYMPLNQLSAVFNGTGNWDQAGGTATISVTGTDTTSGTGTGNGNDIGGGQNGNGNGSGVGNGSGTGTGNSSGAAGDGEVNPSSPNSSGTGTTSNRSQTGPTGTRPGPFLNPRS